MQRKDQRKKPNPEDFQILIIEDNEINIKIVLEILDDAGYHLVVCRNGEDGLAEAANLLPDLILLDVMLPGLDGFDVCRALKADKTTAVIPVIFMTADTEMDSIVQGFELGAIDYIKKPLEPRETLARIRTHLTMKSLREGLQKEIEEKEHLIADLQAFTQTVAHDLKNPVSNVLGFAEILENDFHRLNKDALMETVAFMKQSSLKVYQIIDSLLLLANIRLKEIEFAPINMEIIVLEAKARLSQDFAASEAELIMPESWPQVVGYSSWVEEVWFNYMSNALKYGGLPPCIELGYDELPDGSVRFFVKDNGDGLNKFQVEKLFKPFTRLHSSRHGHGLGLSIVQRIVEKLGGEVGVHSKLGQGSTFFFTLPSVSSLKE